MMRNFILLIFLSFFIVTSKSTREILSVDLIVFAVLLCMIAGNDVDASCFKLGANESVGNLPLAS